MEKIGVFPLGIVIFPGASLPLHIFESRYKTLINEAISEKQAFGINLVDSSRLCQVGCSVEVARVLQRYPDGRLDIAVTGIQRYRLYSLREGEAPYYTGYIEYFDDDANEEIDRELVRRCIRLHNEVIEIVFPHSVNEFSLDEALEESPSFQIAQKAGIDAIKKQELLEMRSENQRLTMLLDYMEAALPQLREKKNIQDIITNDGYLPRTGFKL